MSDVSFDKEFLEKLELLHILSKRLIREKDKGDRRFVNKGTSVEFKDYRNYVVGDDTRTIDWNIYRRLNKLLVKLYEEEVEHYIYLIIDASASMAFGDPTKLVQAKYIAAALSYIALANHDHVSIGVFRDGLQEQLPPVQGKSKIWSVFKFLERLEAKDGTALSSSCKSLVHRTKRRGIAVLLSDLLDPAGLEDGLKQFIYRKYELYLIHTLSPEDESPTLGGELTIVDSETGETRQVSVDEPTLAMYRRAFGEWTKEIEDDCRKRQVVYMKAPTTRAFDDIVLQLFRESRLLK